MAVDPAAVTIAELGDALHKTLHDVADQVNSLSEHSYIMLVRLESRPWRFRRFCHNVFMIDPRHQD